MPEYISATPLGSQADQRLPVYPPFASNNVSCPQEPLAGIVVPNAMMDFINEPGRNSERPSECDSQDAIRTDEFGGLTVFSAVLSCGV
jgi:hypothetical protein